MVSNMDRRFFELPPLHLLRVCEPVGAPDGVPGDGAAKYRRTERQATELAALVARIRSGGATGADRVGLLRDAKQLYREMVKLTATVVLDDEVQELVDYVETEWARSVEFALEGVSSMSEATLPQAGELEALIDTLLEDASVLSQEELESLARARADLDATRLRIVLEMDTQPEQQDDDANSSSVTNEASSATETPSSATETPSSATETPSSATETPSSATETPPSATETPSSATETPPSATETPSSVINEVEDGDALDEGGGGGGGDDQVEFAELGDSADDDDDYDSLGRVAGRAAMKFRGKKLEYFLAVWTGYDIAETAQWLKESEFDTPRRKALLAAYKLQTGGEDDPQGLGWVRRVIEERQRGRGRGRYTEYKVEWLMSNDIPRIERLFDWVRRSELVSPAAVLGRDAVDRVDGAGAAAADDERADPNEFDSDGEENGEENATGRRTRRGALPPEAGTEDDSDMLSGDSSSTLVWDAGSQRAKVSIARTIATLENEEPWLVPALEEWCNWRLYLLMCSVPREASVSAADWRTLGSDLYAIDRDRLDALNDEAESGKSPEEHEQEQTEMLLQRVDTAWRRRRARRERDVSLIRGQLRGLKLLRLRRAGRSDADASQVQVDSMDDDQIRADLQLDDGEQDAKIVADSQRIADAADAGESWWAEFASPPARMHAQGNLLAGSREVGGVRNVAQKSYLGWMRSTMTEKEAELRVRTRLVNGRQRYEYSDEWMNQTWGSPYSSFWPKGKRATPTTTSLEHIVCSVRHLPRTNPVVHMRMHLTLLRISIAFHECRSGFAAARSSRSVATHAKTPRSAAWSTRARTRRATTSR